MDRRAFLFGAGTFSVCIAVDHPVRAQAQSIVKYDDASWHYGGDFPRGLPQSAGATHIAMFVAWAVLNGLGSDLHTRDAPQDLAALMSRSVTPVTWFMQACDEKFTSADLTEQGNSFVMAYYCDAEGLRTAPGSYLADYEEAFPGLETLYHVPATWASYDTIAPIIQRRLESWRRGR